MNVCTTVLQAMIINVEYLHNNIVHISSHDAGRSTAVISTATATGRQTAKNHNKQ